MKTTPQKRFFAFGGKKAFYEESTSNDDNNDTPITLSTTELKELEISIRWVVSVSLLGFFSQMTT